MSITPPFSAYIELRRDVSHCVVRDGEDEKQAMEACLREDLLPDVEKAISDLGWAVVNWEAEPMDHDQIAEFYEGAT